MANIKKTFNFRNGVQVDDDNLLVTSTGLVGIGTTVPTEALDVRGNVKIIGDATITNATVGVLTLTEVAPTQIIGAGVSIKSGIVTAQGTGIVTFYGDARYLQGMPTSQWEDTNAGFAVSSIYNTGGTVGIATTNPQFTLQVGENPNQIGGVSGRGVGISSVGDIKASGIISATTFVGNVTGNLTGNITGNIVGVAASATQLQTARTIGGVSFDGTANINLPGVNIAGNQNTSGTAANLSGTPNILINNLNTAGVSTFRDDVAFIGDNYNLLWDKSDDSLEFGDNTFAVFGGGGDLKIRHNTTVSPNVSQISGSPLEIIADNLELKSGTGSKSYLITTVGGATTLFNDGNEKLRTTGFGVNVFNQLDTTNIVASGVITATTELNSPLIGVGTDIPANDIQVRKSGNAEIQVTSDTGIAGITVGRESGQDNTNNAEFRYGGGGGFPYSSAQSLDIINYGTGNFNYHLSANNAGATAGNFFWHKGSSNVRLMTLTNSGRLGIGLTEPTDELHVDGGATVVGALAVGGNINVTGSIIGNVQGTLTGNVSGTLAGNANATVGISTLNNLTVTGIATISNQRSANISIGDNPIVSNLFNVHVSTDKKVFVNDVGQIGINTSIVLPGVGINAAATNFVVNAIGVGVTQFNNGSVNFSNAGVSTSRFMVPPKVTTSQRNSLVDLTSGAMIYNTSLNKLQVYNGSAWETITSS